MNYKWKPYILKKNLFPSPSAACDKAEEGEKLLKHELCLQPKILIINDRILKLHLNVSHIFWNWVSGGESSVVVIGDKSMKFQRNDPWIEPAMEIDPISPFFALCSLENTAECQRSEELWLNGMLNCRERELDLPVPEVTSATARLHCLRDTEKWQKQNSLKNTPSVIRGIAKNNLTKRQAWQALLSFRKPSCPLIMSQGAQDAARFMSSGPIITAQQAAGHWMPYLSSCKRRRMSLCNLQQTFT